MDRNQILYAMFIMILMLGISFAILSGSLQQINNYFQLQYASMTGQFLTNDMVTFFTTSSFPINNAISTQNYDQMLLNGSYATLTNVTRYIATQGVSIMPLITPYYTQTPLSDYVSVQAPPSLIYANNPSNIPQPNVTSNYIYPLYLMSYTANCSALSTQQAQQIASPNPMIYMLNQCNSTTSNETFYAIVGISNQTATNVDALFTSMNPTYTAGVSETEPLATYNQFGAITTNNTAISGQILGYVVSQTFGFNTINFSGQSTTINPIRDIFKGNFTLGTTFIDNSFCWNIAQSSLTDYLTTKGYTEFPYLYQYYYDNNNYLCLDVNATNTILNATSNIDGSAFSFNPTATLLANGNLQNYDYVIAKQIGEISSFQYLIQGGSLAVDNLTISNPPYWFIPNTTDTFSISPAPNYEFTIVTTEQPYISSYIPIIGQPSYSPISFNITENSANYPSSSIITSINTYLYSPLLSNITYQYQFTQPTNGTPVFCTNICNYNGSLVYQDFEHNYQLANPNFGYLVLPQLNQTLYYTPQFALIAQTPLMNNTDALSPLYGQYCYYTGSPYTCEYGLTPSQIFNKQQNVSTFIMYERINPNDVWQVGSQQITGWQNFVGYLQQQNAINNIQTISKLNSNGGIEYSVTGKVITINPSFIYIIPDSYNINPQAYPPAQPLSTSIYSVIEFIVFIIALPFSSYLLTSIKLNEVMENRKK